MVASSVDVDVLAAEDSAELFECLSVVVVVETGTVGFGFGATVERPFGRTGGLVFPPTELAACTALPLTVLVVFLVLTEPLSVSSSSSSSVEPSSSSEPEVFTGENILFCCLLESETVPPLVLLVVITLSFGVLVDTVVGMGFGTVAVKEALAEGTLDLMLPLPAFDALVLVSPSSCCCCC